MLAAIAVACAHVPTYGVGADGCFSPPHHHTTSQVIYLKGSGGAEIHLESLTKPFDIIGGEIIDVDAVFKEEYDQSTYSLYIGCGGCVWSVDPVVVPPIALDGYEHGEVEPFTQVCTLASRVRTLRLLTTRRVCRLSTDRSFPRRSASSTPQRCATATRIT
jgi:hypothetical protein